MSSRRTVAVGASQHPRWFWWASSISSFAGLSPHFFIATNTRFLTPVQLPFPDEGMRRTTHADWMPFPQLYKQRLFFVLHLQIAMPRIKRHFRPVTPRAQFSPERLLTPPPSTLRTVFALLEPPSSPTSIPHGPAPAMKKPVGEVGKNYKLLAATGLDSKTYKAIEVHIPLYPRICVPHPPTGSRQRIGSN